MSRKAGWVVLGIKAFCAGIIFVATVQTLLILGPWIETRWFPPVSKLTILDIRETADGRAAIDAYFTKLRGECEYVGISWYKGDPAGDFERVPVILLRAQDDTSSPNRPVGSQRAGPWIVSLTPDEVRNNSFVRLSHRCGWPWLTTTDFYP